MQSLLLNYIHIIYIILIIFSLFIGSVEIDATALGIGSVIFTLTASDNEGDNLYYGITCNPSGCPFVLLDCTYDKYFHIYFLEVKKMFEDTKRTIRSRTSTNDRQCNGKKKKSKQ